MVSFKCILFHTGLFSLVHRSSEQNVINIPSISQASIKQCWKFLSISSLIELVCKMQWCWTAKMVIQLSRRLLVVCCLAIDNLKTLHCWWPLLLIFTYHRISRTIFRNVFTPDICNCFTNMFGNLFSSLSHLYFKGSTNFYLYQEGKQELAPEELLFLDPGDNCQEIS